MEITIPIVLDGLTEGKENFTLEFAQPKNDKPDVPVTTGNETVVIITDLSTPGTGKRHMKHTKPVEQLKILQLVYRPVVKCPCYRYNRRIQATSIRRERKR